MLLLIILHWGMLPSKLLTQPTILLQLRRRDGTMPSIANFSLPICVRLKIQAEWMSSNAVFLHLTLLYLIVKRWLPGHSISRNFVLV